MQRVNVRVYYPPLYPLSAYGEPRKVLGRGAFGEVYQYCIQSCTKETSVAVKHSIDKDLKDVIEESLLHEVVALMRMRHPNIVQLVDVALEDNEYMLILPLAGGSLEDYAAILSPRSPLAAGNPNKQLTVEHVGIVMYQLVRALAYLEGVDVRHRDIKPANVLFYEEQCNGRNNIRVVLSDFGLSRVGLCAHADEPIAIVGTSIYHSPELWLGGQYTRSSETWALGCIAYELLTRDYVAPGNPDYLDPYDPYHLKAIIRLRGLPAEYDWPIMRRLPHWNAELMKVRHDPSLMARVSPIIRPVVEKMLQVVPMYRPTGAQLVYDSTWDAFGKDWVETCTPAPETKQLDCEQETIANTEGPSLYRPKGMTPEIRLTMVELVDTLVFESKGDLRASFLALTILDRYLERNKEFDVRRHDIITLATHVCVYLARQLVNETAFITLDSPVMVDVLNTFGIDNFKAAEISILRTLKFDIMVSTAYDIVGARSSYTKTNVIEIAELFLRVAARGMLVYKAGLQDVADLCMIMACAYTGEPCRGDIRYLSHRLDKYKKTFYEGVRLILHNPQSFSRLATSTGRLIDVLIKMPEARAYFGTTLTDFS